MDTTSKQLFWEDPRTNEGQLLWPERFPEAEVKRLEALLGSDYAISSQLQQDPIPKGSGIFKEEYIKLWTTKRPQCSVIINSWDTAIMVKEDSCNSACVTFGLFDDDNGYPNLIILESWYGKLEYPDLKQMILNRHQDIYYKDSTLEKKVGNNPAKITMIEQAANGASLRQDLFRSGLQTMPFIPRHHGLREGSIRDSSKVGRARVASSFVEQGFVHFPAYEENGKTRAFKGSQDVIDALLAFPYGKNADIVDAFSQAILKFLVNDVYYKGQKPKPPKPDFSEYKKPYKEI